jgi:hypothetical protein
VIVYTDPAPGQFTNPGVDAPARKVIVTGTEELFVKVYEGILVPPLTIVSPEMAAGTV